MSDQNPHLPRPRTLQEMREALRQAIAQEDPELPGRLDVGSSHPYSCTCETCWHWWKAMGLGDEASPPFTQKQIDAPTYQAAMQMDLQWLLDTHKPEQE